MIQLKVMLRGLPVCAIFDDEPGKLAGLTYLSNGAPAAVVECSYGKVPLELYNLVDYPNDEDDDKQIEVQYGRGNLWLTFAEMDVLMRMNNPSVWLDLGSTVNWRDWEDRGEEVPATLKRKGLIDTIAVKNKLFGKVNLGRLTALGARIVDRALIEPDKWRSRK